MLAAFEVRHLRRRNFAEGRRLSAKRQVSKIESSYQLTVTDSAILPFYGVTPACG